MVDSEYPYGEFDAQKWAEEFERLYPELELSEGIMLGWFANAIMTGYNKAKNEKVSHDRDWLDRAQRLRSE